MTDQELFDYSKHHVAYEIERLRTAAAVLAKGGLNASVVNLVLESWAVHFRNLIEFLYRDAPRADDVTAAHFYPDPAMWQRLRTPKTATIEAAQVRANKEISHLTTQRIAGTPTNKAWDTAGLTAEVVDELRRFEQAASPTRLSPLIGQLLQ